MSVLATARAAGRAGVARRTGSNSLSAAGRVAALVLTAHLLLCLTGPLLVPHDPLAVHSGAPFEGLSGSHWLGTDNLGRDVFSRLVAGEQVILLQSLSASAIAVLGGSLLGIVTAYARGWLDAVVMRLLELVFSLPSLVLSMLLLAAVGAGHVAVVCVVAGLFVAPVTTVVRAAALSVVSESFVTTARLRGESRFSIAVREILPNVLPTVFVEFSLRTGYAAILIGALGFLGFGAVPPDPDWGLLINEGRNYLSATPWPVLAPALALGSLVLALSLFTERVSDLLGPTGLGKGESR